MDSRRKLNIEIKFVVSDNAINKKKVKTYSIKEKRKSDCFSIPIVFIISAYLPFHLQEYH